MAKKKYKSILATGLAVAGAVQLGTATPANAIVQAGRLDVSPTSEQAIIIDLGEVAKQQAERTDSKTGLIEIFSRGDREITNDNNESWYKDPATGYQISRFTHEDKTPYTGMYMKTNHDNGKGGIWYVLDEDGYLRRDKMKPVYAHMDGKICADFLEANGISYNRADGNYYLGEETTKDGALITYMIMDGWINNGPIWYRSNEKGIAYRNQWFKEPSSGKWYYFGNDCKMVTNKLVDGYWIGADGTWQG